ncbi:MULTISPECIES: hypothetical protein [Brevundimonas]|uniref:hypothetical protein n=1 Tax=Brevundimonas TaxID=41275 RepID=UPI0005F7C324|nr:MULTISPECIES: hypothetical protein [Brevundimonas]KJV37562.1 hypothetical protein VH88_15265 [Brevundimonas sp. KM4]MBC1183988.1 hypothetical protein [Brevundimonas huaxiensis]
MRRSIQLDADRRRVLVTNDFGDHAVLSAAEHEALTSDALLLGHPRHADLEARALLHDTPREHWSDLETAV